MRFERMRMYILQNDTHIRKAIKNKNVVMSHVTFKYEVRHNENVYCAK
jgi:hypothetical protein